MEKLFPLIGNKNGTHFPLKWKSFSTFDVNCPPGSEKESQNLSQNGPSINGIPIARNDMAPCLPW